MRTDSNTTIPPSEITATSLVPPPTSTTMLPTGSSIAMPAPIAAAIGLLDQLHPPGAGRQRRFHDRALLDVRDPRRRAHHHARMREAAAVDPADEVPQHLLGHLEVGDHAVAQGPDRRDRRRRAADHPLGVVADGVHLARAESTATTDGSDTTIPWPRTNTSVFAVPRSIAMSRAAAEPVH